MEDLVAVDKIDEDGLLMKLVMQRNSVCKRGKAGVSGGDGRVTGYH
jgi:hypothetical protein